MPDPGLLRLTSGQRQRFSLCLILALSGPDFTTSHRPRRCSQCSAHTNHSSLLNWGAGRGVLDVYRTPLPLALHPLPDGFLDPPCAVHSSMPGSGQTTPGDTVLSVSGKQPTQAE